MFSFILDNGLSRKIVSKLVARWINEQLDCDAIIEFNKISILAKKEDDDAHIHLDLDLTMNKNKLLQALDERI